MNLRKYIYNIIFEYTFHKKTRYFRNKYSNNIYFFRNIITNHFFCYSQTLVYSLGVYKKIVPIRVFRVDVKKTYVRYFVHVEGKKHDEHFKYQKTSMKAQIYLSLFCFSIVLGNSNEGQSYFIMFI